jgi:hypothetical protein
MPDKSKGGGQTKCNPWSSGLGLERRANDPTPERSTVTKHAEPTEMDSGGGRGRIVGPVKKNITET